MPEASSPRPNRAALNNIVCGLLVFASHWTATPATAPRENLFWCGIAIVGVALATLIAHGQVPHNYWSALNVGLGIWVIVSASIFVPPAGIGWAQTCLGILTTTLALTSLANERGARVPPSWHVADRS
ncbi:MAG TPA: hypothetical protein VMD91_05270 [Candidatus Sulfotelmatobacter sp.]|nr:hypothetical protein [Candidatus Sulfotelmatobacter sp.]